MARTPCDFKFQYIKFLKIQEKGNQQSLTLTRCRPIKRPHYRLQTHNRLRLKCTANTHEPHIQQRAITCRAKRQDLQVCAPMAANLPCRVYPGIAHFLLSMWHPNHSIVEKLPE